MSFFDQVSVGDVISDSCHYSFLVGAVFFIVRAKKGKATLICDKYVTLTECDRYTKRCYFDPNHIEEKNISIRCGKYGAKYDETYTSLTKGHDYFSGSSFD